MESPRYHDAFARTLLSDGDGAVPRLGTLVLYDGQVLFSYEEDHQQHAKLLTYAAVRAAFQGAAVDSGWLPAGTVRVGESPAGAFAVRWIAPDRHRLPVILPGDQEPTWLTVPLPGLVFAGSGSRYGLWATDAAAFDPAAFACRPPLPNIMQDGAVCWGPDNRPPPVRPAALEQAWALFTAAPFNGHMAGGRSHDYPNDVRGQLARLAAADAPSYPETDLMPFGGGNPQCTLAQALDRFLEAR